MSEEESVDMLFDVERMKEVILGTAICVVLYFGIRRQKRGLKAKSLPRHFSDRIMSHYWERIC
jgi:hypothetical protein